MAYHKRDRSSLPVLVEKLLSCVLPDDLKNEIIGDLSEEFYHQVHSNPDHRQAKKWLWQQTTKTIAIFASIRIARALRDLDLMHTMALFIGIVVFVATFVVITLLSHLDGFDDYSFDLSAMLVSGDLHQALAHSEFWQQALTHSFYLNDLNYLFQWPALLWAGASTLLLSLCAKTSWMSKHSIAGLAVCLVFAPYLLGTVYLQHNQVTINQAGSILALMLFSIMYLVVPATVITLRNQDQA